MPLISLSVEPQPLPSLVMKGITFLPLRSMFSKNVTTGIGREFHQFGKPMNTVS